MVLHGVVLWIRTESKGRRHTHTHTIPERNYENGEFSTMLSFSTNNWAEKIECMDVIMWMCVVACTLSNTTVALLLLYCFFSSCNISYYFTYHCCWWPCSVHFHEKRRCCWWWWNFLEKGPFHRGIHKISSLTIM